MLFRRTRSDLLLLDLSAHSPFLKRFEGCATCENWQGLFSQMGLLPSLHQRSEMLSRNDDPGRGQVPNAWHFLR